MSEYLSLRQFKNKLQPYDCVVTIAKGYSEAKSILSGDYYISVTNPDYDVDIDAEAVGNFLTPTAPVKDSEVQKLVFDFANTPIVNRKYNQAFNIQPKPHMSVHELLTKAYKFYNPDPEISVDNSDDKHNAYVPESILLNHENKAQKDGKEPIPMATHETKAERLSQQQAEDKPDVPLSSETIYMQLTPIERKYLKWLRKVGDANGNKIYGHTDADTIHQLINEAIIIDQDNDKADKFQL